MEFSLDPIQFERPLDTPVELLGKLSNSFQKKGGLLARTGVMENTLKEVRSELAFWDENTPRPVFFLTPTPAQKRGQWWVRCWFCLSAQPLS